MKTAPAGPLFALAVSLLGATACQNSGSPTPRAPRSPVGRAADGSVMTPVNQLITPHGVTVDLPGLRPQALALSKDGQSIYVSGKTAELIVLEADSHTCLLYTSPSPRD